jgi:hypothetical protein
MGAQRTVRRGRAQKDIILGTSGLGKGCILEQSSKYTPAFLRARGLLNNISFFCLIIGLKGYSILTIGY